MAWQFAFWKYAGLPGHSKNQNVSFSEINFLEVPKKLPDRISRQQPHHSGSPQTKSKRGDSSKFFKSDKIRALIKKDDS